MLERSTLVPKPSVKVHSRGPKTVGVAAGWCIVLGGTTMPAVNDLLGGCTQAVGVAAPGTAGRPCRLLEIKSFARWFFADDERRGKSC